MWAAIEVTVATSSVGRMNPRSSNRSRLKHLALPQLLPHFPHTETRQSEVGLATTRSVATRPLRKSRAERAMLSQAHWRHGVGAMPKDRAAGSTGCLVVRARRMNRLLVRTRKAERNCGSSETTAIATTNCSCDQKIESPVVRWKTG